MTEASVNGDIREIYTNLKVHFEKHGCRIASEQPPTGFAAVQGSIWGTSPKTAQKKIAISLKQTAAETCIKAQSALAANYLGLTAVGVVFSVVLVLVCFWIGFDLTNYASTGEGFWGWLAYTGGAFSHFEPGLAAVYVRFMWIFGTFLAGTLIVEAIVLYRVQKGINLYAQELLAKFEGQSSFLLRRLNPVDT